MYLSNIEQTPSHVYMYMYVQLMELLEYGLMSSPLTQSEPIMAAFVRVISGIIQTAKKNKIMEPFLFDLQLKIAEKCSQILDKEEDGCKVHLYRLCRQAKIH